MRVGVFTYGMDKQLTGIGRYTVELLQNLRRLSADVEILLLNPYPDSELPLYREFEQFAVPSLAKLPSALTVGAGVLERAARTLGLDILHDPCGIAPFPLLGAMRGAWKRVVTVHDAVPFLFPRLQPLLTNLTFQTRVRWSRSSADAILTVSECAKRDLVRCMRVPESKVHVTELGTVRPTEGQIDAWRKRAGELRSFGIDKQYFLFVGSVNPRKNVARALIAFAGLVGAGVDVLFVFSGPRSRLPEDVAVQADALQGRVVWTGYMDEEQLHVLYANAACVIYPSLYEGFGLPVLEGMAHAVPVISSNTSSIPEVAEGAALLVDPENVPAIRQAMASVLAEPLLAKRLSVDGYERAARFEWPRTAEKTLRVYEDLLST